MNIFDHGAKDNNSHLSGDLVYLQGLIIAMKELDKYEKGLDRIFAVRLEVIS